MVKPTLSQGQSWDDNSSLEKKVFEEYCSVEFGSLYERLKNDGVKVQNSKRESASGTLLIAGKEHSYLYEKSYESWYGNNYLVFLAPQGRSYGYCAVSDSAWHRLVGFDDIRRNKKRKERPLELLYEAKLQDKKLLINMNGAPVRELFNFFGAMKAFMESKYPSEHIHEIEIMWDGDREEMFARSLKFVQCSTMLITLDGHILWPRFQSLSEKLNSLMSEYLLYKGVSFATYIKNGQHTRNMNIALFSQINRANDNVLDKNIALGNFDLVAQFARELVQQIEDTRNKLSYLCPVSFRESVTILLYEEKYNIAKTDHTLPYDSERQEGMYVDKNKISISDQKIALPSKEITTEVRQHIRSVIARKNGLSNVYSNVGTKALGRINDSIASFLSSRKKGGMVNKRKFPSAKDYLIHSILVLSRRVGVAHEGVHFLTEANMHEVQKNLKLISPQMRNSFSYQIDKRLTHFFARGGTEFCFETMVKSLTSTQCLTKQGVDRNSENYKCFEKHWKKYSASLNCTYEIDNDDELLELAKVIRKMYWRMVSFEETYRALWYNFTVLNIEQLELIHLMCGREINRDIRSLERRAQEISEYALEHFSYTGPNGKTYPFEILYYFDPEVILEEILSVNSNLRNEYEAVKNGDKEPSSCEEGVFTKDFQSFPIYSNMTGVVFRKIVLGYAENCFTREVQAIWNCTERTSIEKSKAIAELFDQCIGYLTWQLPDKKNIEDRKWFGKFARNLSGVLGDDIILVL